MHLLRGFVSLGELDVALAPVMLPAMSKVTAISRNNLELPKMNDKFII
jgi:hypothetical protein